MLDGFGQEEQHSFVLRNWSYFELQTMIEYKAARVGIKVVKIDPRHTSQTCSKCGHYEEGQKITRDFKCKSCGEKLDGDYNAALNIARSEKIVTKKE
jgi:transposase